MTKRKTPIANLGNPPKKPRAEHKEVDAQIASQRAAKKLPVASKNPPTGKLPVDQIADPPRKQKQLTIGGTIVTPPAARQEGGSSNDGDRAPDARTGVPSKAGKRLKSFFDSSSATPKFLRYQYVGDNITKDSEACGELMYSIRGNTLSCPRLEDLTCPNLYRAIARSDVQTKAMMNELIGRYESNAAFDLEKIKKLEAELAEEKKKSAPLRNENSRLRNELAAERAKFSSSSEVARLKDELAAEKEAHSETVALLNDKKDLIRAVDAKFKSFKVRFERLRKRLIYLTETKEITDMLCQVKGTLEVLAFFRECEVRVPQNLVDSVGKTMEEYEKKLRQF